MDLRALTPASTGFERLWDSFVLAHPDAGVGHLRANFGLADAAGNRNCSILVAGEKDCPVAVLPLYEDERRDLRVFRRRILTSGLEFPAHPLIAPNLAPRVQNAILIYVLQAVESAAAACHADDVSIAYPAIVGGATAVARYGYYPLRHFGFSDDSGVGLLLDLRRDAGELNRTLEASCRNMIRRAQKEGCSVRPVRDCAEWMACLELARETLGPAAPSERVHRACWEHFVAPGYADTCAIVPRASETPSNVVVSAGWNGNWYYWKSYNRARDKAPGANNLALWEAIVSAQRREGRYFELGSVEFESSKQRAISAFKQSFGGTPAYALRGVRHRHPIRNAAVGLLSAVYHSRSKTSAGPKP
ncbi:MAG TPA: GNAT family N-acetyltransferase [Bryobacteraceae bacterium]